jgi:hypothetical protein
MKMFEKFGEFDSADELNRAAEGLLNEGDEKSLYALAEENGIDREDVEDYIEGFVEELTNTSLAAIGKINVECKELKVEEILEDWIDYVKARCVDSTEVAIAVRKKGKNINGCIAKLLGWSYKHMYSIPADITKAAGVPQNVKLGIPGMGTAKKLIDEYYMGGK